MTIITDAVSAVDLFDKYITRAPLNITVISEDGDTFPPEAVRMLLSVHANIVTAPAGASKMFAFGQAAGSESRAKDTYIITADSEIRKTAELMGFQTQLQKKTAAGKGKTKTTKTKTAPILKQTENSEEKPQNTRSVSRTRTDKGAAGRAQNKAKISEKEAGDQTSVREKTTTAKARKTTKTVKPSSKDNELLRKPVPKPEKVYKDNSDAAGTKPTSVFVKAITKTGVDKADAQGVWNAVAKSTAAVVYDMQLRLCLLDADKAKDIYGKTRDMFDDLKALTGGSDG